MRAFVLLGLVVGACAPGVLPHTEPAAVVLPFPHPTASAPATEPTEIEPDVEPGGCVIEGSTLSLATETVELCGASRRACFGTLTKSPAAGSVESLRVAPGQSPAARLALSAKGVLVLGVVDARALAPHPIQVSVVDGFFVPEWAPLTILGAGDETATLSIAAGDDLAPSAPLVAEWPCDRLSSDSPLISADDVARFMHLGQSPDILVAPSGGKLLLRATANGPVVATVYTQGQPAPVYDRSGAKVRVLLAVDGGYVVGWVDRSGLLKPYGGGHHVHAPRIRMGETRYGFRCPHSVPILVRVGTDIVHAATVLAGTPFDPEDPAEILRSVGLVLHDGAQARITPEELADCHE